MSHTAENQGKLIRLFFDTIPGIITADWLPTMCIALHNKINQNTCGMKTFWGGLIFAAAGLFVLRYGDYTHGSKPLVSWSESTIVNATNSDAPTEAIGFESAPSKREVDRLRERIMTLESEVAALRRQVRALDH